MDTEVLMEASIVPEQVAWLGNVPVSTCLAVYLSAFLMHGLFLIVGRDI